MTAPGGSPADSASPEQGIIPRLDDPPFIPSQEEFVGLSEEETRGEGQRRDSASTAYAGSEDYGDACIGAELGNAMGMLNVSDTQPGNRGPTRVVGRADARSEERMSAEEERRRHLHSPDDRLQSDPPPSVDAPRISPPDLDWKTFGQAYAHGNFDPNKIPHPPKNVLTIPIPPTAHSSPGGGYRTLSGLQSDTDTSSSRTASIGPFSQASGSSGGSHTTYDSASSAPVVVPSLIAGKVASSNAVPTQSGLASSLSGRSRAFELESIADKQQKASLRPNQLNLPSYSLAAATVRMATSGLPHSGFAPLSIPSPDRELLDPMASFVSPTSVSTLRESASSDPGGSRFALNRSMSSTAAPRDREAIQLPTIAASPAGTPLEHPSSSKGKNKAPSELPRRATSPTHTHRSLGPGGIVKQRIPPATAPVEKTVEAENDEDYFGSAIASPFFDRQQSYQSQSSGSNQTVTQQATPMQRHDAPETSSLPSDSPKLSPPPPFAEPGDVGPLYEKYGWLAAPLPPNELARRKALYRFNILHTSPDVNFDRIAHMAKLVFNTKIVIIGLTDTDSQWHKTETGLGAQEVSRISSFCSHTLLVSSGEPLVVLDATTDWRFANNPNVVGGAKIRFYAGAPLRTVDGFNLGTLCVIDDKPRTEFPPRSRLILKEFAAVCMREMELWRDKLQLRVRDRIQTSMEKFTRECLEMDARSSASSSEASARMDQVYARAAQLITTTLDMDGCFILDIGQFELVEITTEQGKQSVYRADPYSAGDQDPVVEISDTFGPVNGLPILASTPNTAPTTRVLTPEEHQKMSDFLLNNRDGRIFENVAPSWIRYMFPPDLRYGMVVPCFGVHQQPFALITAYTCNKAKQYLEGYELQFLRAIGVIILSAVLRRRMVMADKTKSILISSVSHELRTPLHGILAAAELLSDTELDSNQSSFLKTVQTCGNTLIETVNHVLDFTKLSGSGGSSRDGSIKLAKVNLANLVEQTVEGVWIGQRARLYLGDSDIGSFYAPPPATISSHDRAARIAKDMSHVETVVDIGHREKGWMVRCERGGLRRVLMNLVGNSLKFTTDGYIQVTLRELPHAPGAKMIPVEMAVIDTGKGIGKEFLKDQLFHPFSQENPLQTGTGLGLAIVNSIVRSDSVNGKVDVWSSEGLGTEIRISFEVEAYDEEDDTSSSSSVSALSSSSGFGRGHSVSMYGFNDKHRGQVLAMEVLSTYAAAWSFDLRDEGDVLIINEDEEYFRSVSGDNRPIVFITSTQTQTMMHLRDSMKRAGAFVQVIHKPVAPSPFRDALHHAVQWLERRDGGGSTPVSERDRPSMSRGDSGASAESNESASTISELTHGRNFSGHGLDRSPLIRRRSEEQETSMTSARRPSMAPRGVTYHNAPVRPTQRAPSISDTTDSLSNSPQPGSPTSTTSHISTISLADGGVMLKTAQLPPSAPRPGRTARVMVVEDNIINRRVLGAFLKKRGFEYSEAHDGLEGVDLFDSTPLNHWDVILMDISMPNMNGHEATRAIRKIETARRTGRPAETPMVPEAGQPILLPPPKIVQTRAKIFALTGLATADDKREAFGSGVDG